MNKEKTKEYLEYLERKYTEWYSHPKQRLEIEEEIVKAADSWEDEIYLYLNDNRATGLFEHGFFMSDVQKSLDLLAEITHSKDPKIVNKLYSLNRILQDFKVSQSDILRKELRDYLLEKIHNGNVSDGRITFKDTDDFNYFSKLIKSIGLPDSYILEEIVMKSFKNEESAH